MNDKDNDIRSELSLTLGSLKDRLSGLTSNIQNRIKTL